MKTALKTFLLAAATYQGIAQTEPEITLRVLNEAVVEDRIIRSAERSAAKILGWAGIVVEWRECRAGYATWGNRDPCQEGRGPTDFWLRITSHKPKATQDDGLGFTELDSTSGDGSAGICYPAVLKAAKPDRPPVSEILGATIAHEVGHLILGANAHSRQGVMHPRWGREQFVQIGIDELTFTTEQAKKMRNNIGRRNTGPQGRP